MRRVLLLFLCLLLTGCTAAPETVQKSEPPVLHCLVLGGDSPAASDRLSDAISQHTLSEFGFRVDLNVVNMNNYSEYLNTLRLKKELPDLLVLLDSEAMETLSAGGDLLLLNDLLEQHPDLRAQIRYDSEWNADGEGQIYTVPFSNAQPYHHAFAIRRTLCEEVGVEPESILNLDDLEQVLLKIHEKHPDYLCASPHYNMMQFRGWCDQMTDGRDTVSLGVIPYGGEVDTQLSLFTEVPEFREWCQRMYRWRQLGLILEDISFLQEPRQAYMADPTTVGTFLLSKPTSNASSDINQPDAVYNIRLSEDYLDLSESEPRFGIYANSVLATQAMDFLEMLYTDPELLLLCTCGQEGIDYRLDDKGQVCAIQDSTDRHIITLYCWPNNALIGDRLGMEASDVQFISSPAMGFRWDESALGSESVACRRIIQKYYPALVNGILDPDVAIPLLEQELREVGSEALLQRMQQQFDNWLADFQSQSAQ